MSDDIRDELARLLREHQTPIPDDGYPADEYDCCADAILERFLVVPRDQVNTEYGARVILESCEVRIAPLPSRDIAMQVIANKVFTGQVVQRESGIGPWTVIPLPEDGDTQ